MRCFLIFIFLLIVCSANAATSKFSVIADGPISGSTGLIQTFGSRTLATPFQFSFDTSYGYAYRRTNLKPTGEINHLIVNHVGVSYSPSDRWQFDLIAPFVAWNRFFDSGAGNFVAKNGIGDLLLRAHFNFWHNTEQTKGFAFLPFVSLPTGNENFNQGDKYPRGGFKILGDWHFAKHWFAAGNLGVEVRQSVSDLNYHQKGRLLASGGVAYLATDSLTLNTDLVASTAIDHPLDDKAATSIEVMGGATYALKNHPVAFHASIGAPLLQTALQPKFRANLGLSLGFGARQFNLNDDELRALQPTVYFRTSSSRIKNSDRVALDRVAKLLRKYRRINLIVAEGHTDSRGSKRLNQKLSLSRAMAVKNYLIAQSVSAERITVVGFAESRPAASNRSELGRAKNRRVELRLDPRFK